MAINRDKVLEAAQKYVEKKKYDKAVQEYQRLIEADPNDARTLLKIGDLQAKQSLHADAIATYETVGKLYAHQGFALKAIAVYKQIREIVAKHVPQLEERYVHITPKLAELYQQLGLTSDALAALDEVATRLQRQQKDPEAIEVFRRIVELDPTNPLPHLRLAEALSRVRDTDGAVFEFKTAASQLAGIGRRDDALKVLERLLHHKADAEQARICAELYLARGQPQDGMQALSKLQICFQANPRDFDTLSLLARAFNAIGQGAKAIEVQKEMARVARDAGKNDLFREIVERLLRVAPNDDGVRKLLTQSDQVAGGSAYPGAPAHGVPGGIGQPSQLQSGGYPTADQQEKQPGFGRPVPYGSPQPQGPHYAGSPAPQLQRNATANAFPPPPPPLPAHPQTLPRATTAARFPPSPPPIEPPAEEEEEEEENLDDEVEELSYEEVDAEEVTDEAQQAEAYAEADAYDRRAQEQTAYGTNASAQARYGTEGGAEGNAYGAGRQPAAGHDGYGDLNALTHGNESGAVDDLTGTADASEHVHKALADASAFRRMRLYDKALETLRLGLDINPRSMDLHEVYRDILIESDQTEDAVLEMLVIASLYIDSLDGDSAARALQDVLAFDPQNGRAIEMLQELGYEIVDENEGAQPGEGETAEGDVYGEEPQLHGLPAYELEEVGATEASPRYTDEANAPIDRGIPADDELPSFPLDEPDADLPPSYDYADSVADSDAVHARTGALLAARAARGGSQVSRAPSAPPTASMAIHAGGGAGASRELEDALDEAEFFCSRGLFDDARTILDEQLTKHPKNPLLRERIAELDAQDEQRAGSGARERPREADRAYDLAASIDALEILDYDALQPAEGHASADEQVDVEEVFAKFKEGVAKQISVDDSDSHYNLGIAYKEMMLIDDAIREFEVAAQDPKRECVCRSMIGMIEIERGRMNEAIDAFLKGLASPNKDPQQETVLCYEIGAAYEAKKMNKDALSYYQKAMRRDPNYRDVQERVRRLAKNEAKPPQRQAAVGADDEFDRAFDDLVSKA